MVYKRSKFNKVAQYLFFISLFWCLLGNIYSGLAEADKLTHNDWYYCVDADNLTGEAEEKFVWETVANGGSWEKFDYPELPKVPWGTSRLWLKTTLPLGNIPDAALFLQTTNQSFAVWLDGHLIYKYGDLQQRLGSYGQCWHMIMLPPDYGGRQLLIHAYSMNMRNLGNFSSLRLNSNVNQMSSIVRKDLPYIANIPLVIFMILLMILYFSSPAAPKRLYISVNIFLLEYLVWMICASSSKQLLLNAPVMWWFLMRLMVYLLPMSANIIVYQIIDKKYRRTVWGTVLAFAAILVMALLGELAGWEGFDGLASVYYIALPILEGILLVVTVSSAIGGNGYCRAAMLPILGIAGAGSLDGLLLHFHLGSGANEYMLPYSTITVAVFLLYIVKRQIQRERYLMARAAGLEDAMAEAIEKAEVDPLTQCYNRAKLDRCLKKAIQGYYKDKKTFSLIMLDIDFFKRINDKYGHDAGDDVLTGFTALIRSCIKKTDLFVRWGGEEFILLCNDCTGKEASAVAERLRKVVENTDISAKEKITCSIGVAEWEGLFDSSKRLLKRVDTALYKAKEEGRNRVCCQLLAEEIIE